LVLKLVGGGVAAVIGWACSWGLTPSWDWRCWDWRCWGITWAGLGDQVGVQVGVDVVGTGVVGGSAVGSSVGLPVGGPVGNFVGGTARHICKR